MNKQTFFPSSKTVFWMFMPVIVFLMSSCTFGSNDNPVQPSPSEPQVTVEEQSVIKLPSGANLSMSDIELLGDGLDVSVAEDGTFESDASTFLAFHNDEIVHITFGCDYEASSLNSMETAVSLLLPTLPFAVTDMDSEKFWFLKQMIAFLEPTRKLSEAIDKSIVQYGCLNLDAISPEYQAALKELKSRLGFDDVSQTRGMQIVQQRSMTRAEAPFPYFTGTGSNRVEGDGFTLTLDEKKLKEKNGKDYWDCKFTLYNANCWVYTSITKAYKKENGRYSQLTPGFTDTFTHLVKPMNVSAFMDWGALSDIATNPKETFKIIGKLIDEGPDENDLKVVRFFTESWDTFANIYRAWKGEETKIITWDTTILKDIEFSFYDNNEHLMIMGPGINDQLLMFNVLKICFQPLLKMIYGEIIESDGYDNSSDMDMLFVGFMEELFSEVNLEFTTECLAIIKDPNKSWKEKMNVLPKILEKFIDYVIYEAVDILSDLTYQKMREFKGKGFDDPLVKSVFLVYNTTLVGGDIIQLAFQHDYSGIAFEMTHNLGKEETPLPPICVPVEAVDLGLPSGTLWASYNVGASTTAEKGGTYAWGDTEEKEELSGSFYEYELWNNYKWCIDGTYKTVTKYTSDSKTILDLEDDVAHVKWGGSWRMPTYQELKELIDNCSSEWKPNGDMNGWWLTGTNGKSIFLPAGNYWSSELVTSWKAYILKSNSKGLSTSQDDRPWPNLIRPVCKE